VGDWANFGNWPNLVPHDLLLYFSQTKQLTDPETCDIVFKSRPKIVSKLNIACCLPDNSGSLKGKV
jgi:hypothetical protein